jgi:predicted aldo/keto reductase-like oxidoreductase
MQGGKMQDKQKGCSRRQFLKAAGACGLGALVAVPANLAPAAASPVIGQNQPLKVPTRAFGKSGINVSILALGGMFDIAANQLMLKQAIQWGVTYWDTADCYHAGSEAGIGKYFAKYPEDRAKVFLVTKSDARDPAGISRLLKRSLARLNTEVIDLYFIHGIRSIDELNADTRKWAETAKAEKKIRLFGFSTHSNMEDCLAAAAGLGWIDGIMMSYNYRNMNSDKMKTAVDACAKAGIGLTAMKTQAGSSWFGGEGDEILKKARARGLTEEQARLKAVWHNPQISSICSQMDSMKLLKANAVAACDPMPLSGEEMHDLQRNALATPINTAPAATTSATMRWAEKWRWATSCAITCTVAVTAAATGRKLILKTFRPKRVARCSSWILRKPKNTAPKKCPSPG